MLSGWWVPLLILARAVGRYLERPEVSKRLGEKANSAIEKTAERAERAHASIKKRLQTWRANRWVPPADDPAVKGAILWEASRQCLVCRGFICAEAVQCPLCGYEENPGYVKKCVAEQRAALGTDFKNGQIQCPRCRQWDIRYGTLEGGSIGLWCPYCNKSLQELRGW